MNEREHYYYCIYAHSRWEIVKAYNKRQMKANGYDLGSIAARYRHYFDARAHIHAAHSPDRIAYVNLTTVDLID